MSVVSKQSPMKLSQSLRLYHTSFCRVSCLLPSLFSRGTAWAGALRGTQASGVRRALPRLPFCIFVIFRSVPRQIHEHTQLLLRVLFIARKAQPQARRTGLSIAHCLTRPHSCSETFRQCWGSFLTFKLHVPHREYFP